jgi:hypothetical protein
MYLTEDKIVDLFTSRARHRRVDCQEGSFEGLGLLTQDLKP